MEFLQSLMLFVITFIGLPVLVWMCGYMLTRSIAAGIIDSLDKINKEDYEEEQKQKE